jgi:hypothetical protein
VSLISAFASAFAGTAIWLLCNAVGGVDEPWDSEHFLMFYGLACLTSIVLGAFAQRLAFATGAIVIFAMVPVMLVTNGELGALFAVGLFMLAVLALPAMAAAQFGAVMRSRFSGDHSQ